VRVGSCCRPQRRSELPRLGDQGPERKPDPRRRPGELQRHTRVEEVSGVLGQGRRGERVPGLRAQSEQGRIVMTSELKLTAKDFKSDQEVRWCPGCGDYAILAAVQSFMPELGIEREKMV